MGVMGLLGRFWDRRRFQTKIANFSHPIYFPSPLTGLPLELGSLQGVKKPECWGYQMVKKV